jgi:purine-binding chemotaxis protein CheW
MQNVIDDSYQTDLGNAKKMIKDPPSQRTEEIVKTAEGMATDREELYERDELKEETLQLIVFRLGREWYGVEITKVKEVIKVSKVTYLPSAPEHIAGIISLRGNILSIMDLKMIFNLPHEMPTDKTRIMAIESGILETGFLVDEVVETIEVPVSKMEPSLLTLSPDRGKYIEGQCKLDNKLIALINVEKVLEKGT